MELPIRELRQYLKNNAWKGVIIEDYAGQNCRLHLELTTAELRSFAFYIADQYLNEIGEVINYNQPQYDF